MPWNWLGSLRRGRSEADMREELEDHLRARVADLVAQGMERPAAEKQARREFGSLAATQEDCRESWALSRLDAAGRAVTIAVRQLRRDAGFTFTAVLILALCIGANTAMFSVVDAALFRPLPYPQPERLAQVVRHIRSPRGETDMTSQSGAMWEYLRANVRAVELAVTGATMGVNLALNDASAVYVQQHRVSAGYFRVLGVRPRMGREMDEAEDKPGGPAVAVISETLWRTRFGGDRNILGREIRLRGDKFQVVGVMPAEFIAYPPVDVWTPLRASTKGEGNGANYSIVGRVRDGYSWRQADDELSRLTPAFFAGQKIPAEFHIQFAVVPILKARAEGIRRPILLLWLAVGLVLLIGCVNIAGLLLARGEARAQEVATRLALGSSRAAVARQLLTENLLVALAGGAAGAALAYGLIAWFGPAIPATIGVGQVPQIDARALALAILATAATVMGFGVYPAWSITRLDLQSSLRNAGRTASARRPGVRQALLVGEVALTVVLLAGAGLVLRTLAYLNALEPGYDGTNVLTAGLSLQDARYATTAAIDRLFDESLARLRANGAVESAGIMLTLPYERALNSPGKMDDGPHAGESAFTTNVVYVTPGVFETLRIPLKKGRLFDARDRRGRGDVAIVNEEFVRRYLRGDEPLGRHPMGAEIVGVVGDTQISTAWDVGPVGRSPVLYVPAAQTSASMFQMVHGWFTPKWMVRLRDGRTLTQAGTARMMQQAMAEVDPLLPFAEFRAMDEVRTGRFRLQRMETVLLGSLAVLAFVLALVGIFGLIAQSVAERRREFGIRLALGAPSIKVVLRAARQGLILAAVGVAIGSGLALLSAKYIRALLWGVEATDPTVFLTVGAGMVLAALIASLLPSWKIAKLDPMQTLRAE